MAGLTPRQGKHMSTQATRRNETPTTAAAGGKSAAKKASFFKMRAQMLQEGRTNTLLARTDNMWATLKVYASGGENGLHTHPNEDHMFVVLQGSARFFGPNDETADLGKYQGIMLPAGSYYKFQSTSEEPLGLMREGCQEGT